MSHTLRRMQRADNSHMRIIQSDELGSFWREGRLPTPQQQADNLILWLGEHQPTAFEPAEDTVEAICATIGVALAAAGDTQGFGWLHSELEPKDLYRNMGAEAGRLRLRLTMAGWTRYEDIRTTKVRGRTAFMAMKFGDQALDRVVADCFKPAVSRAGFDLRLLTDEQPAGLIDDQLRAAILSARFLLADLSHGNAGAYWEAGFAEGLAIPVIYTCEASRWEQSKTHFDTNHLVTIVWNEAELDKAGRQLTATIRATLRGEAKQSDD